MPMLLNMSQNNKVAIDPNYLEGLKEKFVIPKATIPSVQELNMYNRLHKIEERIGEHSERIAENLNLIKINTEKAVKAANTSLRVENNMVSASSVLATDTKNIQVSGTKLQNTIKKEVGNIEMAFEEFGKETKNSASHVSGSLSGLGSEFINTANRISYPLSVISTYAARFRNDGIIYMPYNGYVCFLYGFVRSNGALPALRTSFSYLRNRCNTLSNSFSNYGNTVSANASKLKNTINKAIDNINIALTEFLNSFGLMGSNLSKNLATKES